MSGSYIHLQGVPGEKIVLPPADSVPPGTTYDIVDMTGLASKENPLVIESGGWVETRPLTADGDRATYAFISPGPPEPEWELSFLDRVMARFWRLWGREWRSDD